jgi:hypothetical protein
LSDEGSSSILWRSLKSTLDTTSTTHARRFGIDDNPDGDIQP